MGERIRLVDGDRSVYGAIGLQNLQFSGPLPLARGGLGWGSRASGDRHLRLTLNGLSTCMEAGETSFFANRAPTRNSTHSFLN
ncbi:hypothetical protein [Oscillatoria sp. HE19RPO]|uniref:hypothetical protein n=1 Tax=Oscillatoria sp. HE19RPO TaxID=2954806 RepID=UPI0020C20CF2|nr:hypothetical protein [Oscillatoria sp. HE19RPO]